MVFLLLFDLLQRQVRQVFSMLNATLFIRGSIYQGDNRFSDISRGRECAFMSLSALLSAHCDDISTWTTNTMDCVLAE